MASIASTACARCIRTASRRCATSTLEIADGELLVLVGPSGSGKSTVLRLIAGLETPTAGTDPHRRPTTSPRVPPQQRDLAMVFQSYALYPHKTVRENLAFGLRMRRVDRARDRRARRADVRRRWASRRCSIASRRSCRAASGSASRSAARSCASRRRFCSTSRCRTSIRCCASTRAPSWRCCTAGWRATMVYVTHDQEEAMTLGTRIAVMREGG